MRSAVRGEHPNRAAISGSVSRVASWRTSPVRRSGTHALAARVSLECRPALELIARYGQAPDVLLYVDPPYLGATRSGCDGLRGGTRRYQHELLGDGEHRELLGVLLGCRAAVVLSGYPSALYDELLTGWDRAEFASGTGQSARGEWSQRTEVVWSNRPLGVQGALAFGDGS